MRRINGLATAALVGCLVAPAFAASPAPSPTPGDTVTLRTAKQPLKIIPRVKLHADYEVAVNKLGQVTTVLTAHDTKDLQYNALTYGNVLQIAIRTPDGMHAVVGKYRVNYDYDPTTQRVSRTIDLLSRGGVDENAEGAVPALQELSKKANEKAADREAAAKEAAAKKKHTLVTPIPSAKP